jgi:hypothetical protein
MYISIDMKSIIKFVTVAFFTIFTTYPLVVKAQSNGDSIIFKAMKDELHRNMTQLTLDQYKPPFFLAYQVSDLKMMFVKASLGSIIQSQENENRTNYLRLMVGDYSLDDENFSGGGGGVRGTGYLPMPADDDYYAIRRAFWSMSDQVYKSALNNYEHKLAALKQQTDNNKEKLDDYSRITPVNMILKDVPFDCNKAQWENTARNISEEFKNYKDIMSSSVNVFAVNKTIYYTTSEGTTLRYPETISFLSVTAEMQADDGEPLDDYLLYYASTPDQLPPADKIKQDVKKLASNLDALRKAPVLDDSYSGPVIFEGDAAGEMFTSLFGSDGLIASREPVTAFAGPSVGSPNKLESRMNQRICPENISITSIPKTKTFNNIPLVGNYEVDAEGVVPKDELTLVDKGILKTLLNNRIPTRKVKESNGHCRADLFRGGSGKAPGVIDVLYNKGKSLKVLYKEAIKEAKRDGLEYIYVVRKFNTNAEMPLFSGNDASSKPIAIYRVSCKTGEEQLVRSAYISDFQMTDFKKIIGGTQEQFVYNTVISGEGTTVPASFIVPKAIVFDDISIEKDNGSQPKKPVVPNPLEEEK